MLLHGFTQTARSWGAFGASLGARRCVVAVDLPGHGGSGDVGADDLWAAASLVLDAVAAGVGEGPFDLCGYSLGGRVALHVALNGGGRVGRLVLLSATAGIDDPEVRATRRARDDQLASEIETENDVAAFVGRWLAQPMFAGLDAGAAAPEDRTRNTAAGLAASLRTMGTGAQEPLWDRLGEVEAPTLVVTGARDLRFTRTGRRLRDGLGNATLASIPGAGHAAHLEQPALTARLVGHWLDAVGH